MAIKAIGFRVLIKPDEVKTKSAGGIQLVVDETLEKNAQDLGTIVDIGEDAFKAFRPNTQFCGLKIGDRVYYARYAGKWCKNPAKPGKENELLVINDEDIVAKWEEADANPSA